MLVLDGLTKAFGGKTAVDAVSLQIPKGQMVGIIGRSGAGKSTMLRMLNLLETPTSGRILWNGEDVTQLKGAKLRAWRTRAAMIFQQFNLVPRLDVITNVLLGRLNHHSLLAGLFGIFSAAERAFAIEALDRLDMTNAALQRADTLSGGQQQRVAIARALAQQPELILADEPIASLDPVNAKVVMDALRRINREDGITVLCNLHTLDTARHYCDRVIAMNKGRVVYDGDPQGLNMARLREIYGLAPEDTLEEGMTSVSLPAATAAAGA